MNTKEILEKAKPIIADKLGINEDEVLESKHFINDLGADSLALVDIIMSLEEVFGMEIPEEDSEKIQTVGQMVEYIANHVK
ncbi:MAG: acyl carrier protein [Caldisericia bacterium]|nr:acyl carrier protein [Caldisericia bacterium]